jgi:tripartite-type tricarboxylate transporter receptor subunit TctC
MKNCTSSFACGRVGRRAIVLSALVATAGISPAVFGQAQTRESYPSRPIQLIVPYGPGTGADGFARIITQKMSETLNQQVVVANRPGASGVIGATAAARSAPDGYTLLLASTPTNAIAPSLDPNLQYDPVKDFQAVARVVSYPYVLAVSSTIPVSNVQELVSFAKARPGTLNYGSTGEGTGVQLAGALFSAKAGVSIKHVAYNSFGQLAGDLSSGTIHMVFYPYQALVPLLQAGKIRVIGSTGAKRSSSLSDIATIAEQGVADYEIGAWLGINAPAGTPPERIEILHNALKKVVEDPKVAASLRQGAFDVDMADPKEYLEFTKQEVARYRNLIHSTRNAAAAAR